MKKIKVIVVDDHKMFRLGMESLLKTNIDFEVIPGVSSGRELDEVLANNEINVVLLDISLATESGLELLDKLTHKYPILNFIMLTMHEEIQYVKESMQKGAKGYLLKESGEQELFEAIYDVSRGKKYFKNKVSDLLIEDMTKPAEERVLTDREKTIVRMVADGKITKEIADKLSISVRTVETHRGKIMKKLGVSNASEMIRTALDKNLI
ncbi:MAG: response regulator transcription factor [Cyclobacteriaceae bacterium]|nr:response regulator transcription factor [Cyclobacteriaceae bacterium HetDA_MAG_MS6]